jgi:hypothetical protein
MQNDFRETIADPSIYRPCFEIVYAACAVLLIFLFVDLWRGSAQLFHRSGALAVFMVAVAQFMLLSRRQKKLDKNLSEAMHGGPISLLSPTYRALEWRIFVVGLIGTIVNAYGDLFTQWLISLK